jgi:acyl-coenzyme A thioesterase PaaI-like protein
VFHFVRAARQGPFVAQSTLLAADRHTCDVEVEIIEATGKTCALAICRLTDQRFAAEGR